MALKSGLQVWCFTAPGQTYYGPSMVNYGPIVESLRFSTVEPGGYGQLSCKIPASNARIPRPELALFSRIAVTAPTSSPTQNQGLPTAVFLGEITQPELSMDQSGEYWTIQALGIGNCLRDDPGNVAYLNQTPAAIVNDQMTRDNRTTWMPLSTDQTQVFPDNPVATFSPSYMGYAAADVLNDICILAGGYSWYVWAHPRQVDSSWQMPLGQLYVHLRDTTTVGYQAFLSSGDIHSWKVAPAADRAYNAISLAFNDPAHNGYGIVSVTDSRLGALFAQGAAPFRFRRYFQDFSGTSTVTMAEAQAIETTQLAIMQNPTNKTHMVLRGVRNGQGSPIPLWTMQAGTNIQAPELAQRGQQLALSAVAEVNLFHILSTDYAEDSSGNMQQTLQLDNWYDFTQVRIARLENQAYLLAQNGTVTSQVQALGSPVTSRCGAFFSNATAGQTVGVDVAFPAVCAQVPTSVTLTTVASGNATGVAASNITVYGFTVSWTATANGATSWRGTYQTVGN